jgi:hypothetical protein
MTRNQLYQPALCQDTGIPAATARVAAAGGWSAVLRDSGLRRRPYLQDRRGIRATFSRQQRIRFLQDGVAAVLDHVWGHGIQGSARVRGRTQSDSVERLRCSMSRCSAASDARSGRDRPSSSRPLPCGSSSPSTCGAACDPDFPAQRRRDLRRP